MKIKNNFFVISNYNNDLGWLSSYPNDYVIYDRSDSAEISEKITRSKIIKSPNVGFNLYDYLTFIINHYDNLPDCMIFIKGNVMPRHVSQEYFNKIINNTSFTPIIDRKMHGKTFWPISFFDKDGLFNEINNSWYTKYFSKKYFSTYNDFLRLFYKNPGVHFYTRFAPGANYIVPKETILRLPKIVYENLRLFVSHATLPSEAHILERALYTIWTSKKQLNPKILKPINDSSFKISDKKLVRKIFYKIKINFLVLKNRLLSKNAKNLDNKQVSDIKEYQKNIKIYDIFTYNGEADILEIRLNILNDSVDQFIIVEAPTTFSGKDKPLYFQEQKERFSKFSDKIQYFVTDNYPSDLKILELSYKSPNIPRGGPEHWRREFYQKESIKKALASLKDDDFCFISDVDEIWNPNTIIDYRKDDIFKLRQFVYVYYLNNKSDQVWAGTTATKYKNIKGTSLNDIRSKHITPYTYIKNGGWHFTNMGGLEEIKRKLKDSYTEESYNTKDVRENLDQRFGTQDYIGRNYSYSIDESLLPKYIIENKERYKNLLK